MGRVRHTKLPDGYNPTATVRCNSDTRPERIWTGYHIYEMDTGLEYKNDGSYYFPVYNLIGGGAESVDASATRKGVMKLDRNPTVSTDPVAAGANHPVFEDFPLHALDTENPHSVTIEQVGGVPQAELDNHVQDGANPHGVTASQAGAATQGDIDAHANDTENPHQVTAEQVGASPEGHTHAGDTAHVHEPTGVAAGSYGFASFTVDEYGNVTEASSNSPAGVGPATSDSLGVARTYTDAPSGEDPVVPRVEDIPELAPGTDVTASNPLMASGGNVSLKLAGITGQYIANGGVPWSKIKGSVTSYGAVGDGVTDDTDAIQDAINAEPFVIFPPSTGGYRIGPTTRDPSASLQIPSDRTLIFYGWPSRLTTKGNARNDDQRLLRNASYSAGDKNISILGNLVIVGNTSELSFTTEGEHGGGFALLMQATNSGAFCRDIYIQRAELYDWQGIGFRWHKVEGLTVDSYYAKRPRRGGLIVKGGKNINCGTITAIECGDDAVAFNAHEGYAGSEGIVRGLACSRIVASQRTNAEYGACLALRGVENAAIGVVQGADPKNAIVTIADQLDANGVHTHAPRFIEIGTINGIGGLTSDSDGIDIRSDRPTGIRIGSAHIEQPGRHGCHIRTFGATNLAFSDVTIGKLDVRLAGAKTPTGCGLTFGSAPAGTYQRIKIGSLTSFRAALHALLAVSVATLYVDSIYAVESNTSNTTNTDQILIGAMNKLVIGSVLCADNRGANIRCRYGLRVYNVTAGFVGGGLSRDAEHLTGGASTDLTSVDVSRVVTA